MSEFFRAGGFIMWIVLFFSVFGLVAAGTFVYRPRRKALRITEDLARATLYSVLTGLCANVAAVGYKVPSHPEWSKSPDIHLIVMGGIAESLAPAILGFTALSLIWFLLSVGHRRAGEDLAHLA